MRSRRKTISITIQPDLLKIGKRMAEAENKSFSRWIEDIVRRHIENVSPYTFASNDRTGLAPPPEEETLPRRRTRQRPIQVH